MTPASNLPEPIQEPHLAPRQLDPDRLISVYLRTLTSPQTIKTYNTELRMFLSYLEGEIGKGLEELTAEDLSLYREHLIKTYASATAAKKLAALRRFLIFTYMAGATAVNPEALRYFAKSPRVRQDPSYNVLTEDELSRMLSAARKTNYRDYVLLAVMAGCGLREAEVVDVRIGDFRTLGGARSCSVCGVRGTRSETSRSHPSSGSSSSASFSSQGDPLTPTSTPESLSFSQG